VSDGGFLARWSRRKADARTGGEAADAAPPAVHPESVAPDTATTSPASPPVAAEGARQAPAPAPTLADVAQLGRDADFARFVAPGVGDEVKRAAMKKLFADPRFNVMDGLDTYIEDYGRADPLPAAMLRQMAQARALGLFDDEQEPAPPAAASDPVAAAGGGAAPAGSSAQEHNALPADPCAPDENPDLRLQQDDAARCGGAGRGARS
jgi:hypothetical protein